MSIETIIADAIKGSESGKALLLERLTPLVLASIRKYHYRPEDFEDLKQEGYLELLDALDTYNPEKGVPFLGYVKNCLKYFYLNKNRKPNHFSLDMENEEGLCLLDTLADDCDLEADYLAKETSAALYHAWTSLTSIEQQVVYDFYFKGWDLKTIAKVRKVSYWTCVHNKKRGLNRLKKTLIID